MLVMLRWEIEIIEEQCSRKENNYRVTFEGERTLLGREVVDR